MSKSQQPRRLWAAEPIYRLPRLWSNDELRRLAPHLAGDVVNVSAWRDEDKEGGHYRDYFTAATSYSMTNYRTEARGFQGQEGELFLDLEQPLPAELEQRFDVVFNHTTLEHVYQVWTAFANLCAMSKDTVVVVVPFLQPMHGDYGDYWRFTPQAMKRMFEDNGLGLVYSSFNSHPGGAVYVFALGSRHPERWSHLANEFDCSCPPDGKRMVGGRALRPTLANLAGRLWQRARGGG